MTIRRHTALRGLSIALGLLFLVAAAGKVLDIRPVVNTIAFLLTGRPSNSILFFGGGYALVAAEVFLATLLILRRPSWKVLLVAFTALVTFTIALLMLAANPDAPDCGCLSLLRFAADEAASAESGLARNSFLLVATAWMLSAACPARGNPEASPSVSPTVRRNPSAGFTLVELLLVIAVIAVLIALAAPSLLGTRLRAKMTWSLSTQRQLLASVSLYTTDHDDVLPHLGVNGEPGPGLIHHDGTALGRDYFQTHILYWSSLIYPAYFDNLDALESDSLPHESYTQDVLGLKNQVRSNFLMSYNAWADFRLWNDGARQPTVRLLRATRTGEILFPSQKGLLLDVKRGALNQSEFPGYRNLSVGRADGSAGELDWWSVPLSAVYSNPDWPVQWKLPVLATRDGLAGRDF